MKHIRSILYICACGLALAIPAVAQAHGGSVTGIVKDEQGGVIPGADVSLQGSDASYPFVTDRDGTFRFLSLEPGLYKLAASLAGFKTAQRDVIVAAGRNADAPLTLRIAAVTESVERAHANGTLTVTPAQLQYSDRLTMVATVSPPTPFEP